MSYAGVVDRGVGAYPTDACYDPTRPTWLPYWLDDLTESSCKYPNGVLADLPQAGTNIAAVAGQAVGGGVADTLDAVGSGVIAATEGATATASSNLTGTGGSTGLVLLGILGLGLLFLVKK